MDGKSPDITEVNDFLIWHYGKVARPWQTAIGIDVGANQAEYDAGEEGRTTLLKMRKRGEFFGKLKLAIVLWACKAYWLWFLKRFMI